VVPADNPAGIESIEDLDADDVDYAVCVDTAPCGKSAAALLDDLGFANEPATEEVDVKATLQKVTSGQVDAGLVYVTDALAAGDDVQQIEIPEADTQPQNYPIALLQQSEDAELAQEFIDLVLSDEGQQVLADAGFGAAP
jgi:molybdate transport system substrate-binding protein